jgi:hypothetical protein
MNREKIRELQQEPLRRRTLTVVACLLLIVGCGKPGISVEGHVTWGGKPVEQGSISFAPADGKGPSLGTPITNGAYSIVRSAGMTVGKKNVEIIAIVKTGRQIEAGPPMPPGTKVDELKNVSSREICEVVAGSGNQCDFCLKATVK